MAVGWLLARFQKRSWAFPPLSGMWLVIVAFIPQFISFYLPATRSHISNLWVSVGLLGSQILLLLFCWFNRRLAGIWLLAFGLVLNVIVISVNGGFMPISPQTAARIVPQEVIESTPLGSRLGYSKDILLEPAQTHLGWLSDRFSLPKTVPYYAAFSLGDVVIALGALWLLASQGKPLKNAGKILKEAECYRPRHINPPSL